MFRGLQILKFPKLSNFHADVKRYIVILITSRNVLQNSRPQLSVQLARVLIEAAISLIRYTKSEISSGNLSTGYAVVMH